EQPSIEHDQRQHADHVVTLQGRQVHGVVPEGTLEHAAPAPQVIAAALGTAPDEPVPAGLIDSGENPDLAARDLVLDRRDDTHCGLAGCCTMNSPIAR